MNLTSNTKIGLTFGQILSLITVAAAFVMGYRDIDLRINQLEQNKIQVDKQLQINESKIEKVYTENRQDHAIMFQKFDQILYFQKSSMK